MLAKPGVLVNGDWVEVILLQRRFAWNEEDWFAPLEHAVAGLGAAEAAWPPPGGGNTIRQNLAHLTFFDERLLRRLGGEHTPAEADNRRTFGPAGDPADEAGWSALVERTNRVARALPDAIRAYWGDPARPLEPGGSRPLRDELALWVAHDVYHTGQIVLLRRQQGSWPAARG